HYLSSLCIPFFLNDTATTEIYTLSLHDALPISAHLRVIEDNSVPCLLCERILQRSSVGASGIFLDRVGIPADECPCEPARGIERSVARFDRAVLHQNLTLVPGIARARIA